MGETWGVHGGAWGISIISLTCPSSSSTWQGFYTKEGNHQRHDRTKVIVCYERQTVKFSLIISGCSFRDREFSALVGQTLVGHRI